MKICRNCYVLNDDGAERCWNCGNELADSPPYIPVMTYPNPIRTSERENVLILAALTFIFLILLVPAILGGLVVTGQDYTYDLEPNNSFSQAANVSLCDSSLRGFVNEYTDRADFYRFSLDSTEYQLNLSLSFEDRNLFNITAYDSRQNPINGSRSSDSGGSIVVERLNITGDGNLSGVYVKVTALKGGGEYSLRYTVTPDQCGDSTGWDSVDWNDIHGSGKSFDSAIPADGGRRYGAELDAAGAPVEIYSLTLSAGQFLRANISIPYGMEANATLYDSEKTPVSSAPFFNDRGQVRFPVQESGRYYLVLRAFRGEGAVYLDVSISENGMYDGNNDMASATQLSTETTGEVDYLYDSADYLSFFMTRGSVESLNVTVSGQAFLSVTDDEGTVIRAGLIDNETAFSVYAGGTGMYYLKIKAQAESSNYSIFARETRSGTDDYLWIVNGHIGRQVYAGDRVSFRAVLPSNASANILWEFGDGDFSEPDAEVNHSFAKAGNYTITATRTDNGHRDTYNITVRDHEKLAVVIGISDYIESTTNDLQFCHRDALDWASYLEERGYSVTLLLNHSATKDGIISAIQGVEGRTVKGDTLLFVYSGHGFGTEERQYIAPADTESFSDENDISDLLLRALLMTSRSERRLVFLDSCYSGGMREVADSNTLFISASSASELSIDSADHSNGLWTYYFLKVGLIKDGYASAEKAFNAVAHSYTEDAERNYDMSPHPVMIDNDPNVNFVI